MVQTPPDNSLIAEKNKFATPNAPIWLYELDVDDTNTVYLANNVEDVTVREGQEDEITYQAFPVEMSEIEDSNEANLGRAQITVANITDEFWQLLEEHNAFVGRRVRKLYVWSNLLDFPIPRWSAHILEANATEVGAVFTVGDPDVLEQRFPRSGYFATCTFIYRGRFCRYPQPDEHPAGVVDMPTCSHELEGPHGCRAHGQSYVDAGHGALSKWPQNYGGFITIPRRRQ